MSNHLIDGGDTRSSMFVLRSDIEAKCLEIYRCAVEARFKCDEFGTSDLQCESLQHVYRSLETAVDGYDDVCAAVHCVGEALHGAGASTNAFLMGDDMLDIIAQYESRQD